MDRAEAIERLDALLSKCWTGAAVVSGDDFKALNMAIAALREQQWISVKERLPEPTIPVLTYGRKGAIGIGFTQPTSVKDGKVYFYARYGDNLPTHWMSLPEPPKEGAQE